VFSWLGLLWVRLAPNSCRNKNHWFHARHSTRPLLRFPTAVYRPPRGASQTTRVGAARSPFGLAYAATRCPRPAIGRRAARHGYNGGMLAKGQFTLRALFVATAFIAAACALVRFIATTNEPAGQFEVALLVPILICGAVGTLRGRVQRWLAYGVMVECALMAAGTALVTIFELLRHRI
jgi:hypothetical protein